MLNFCVVLYSLFRRKISRLKNGVEGSNVEEN